MIRWLRSLLPGRRGKQSRRQAPRFFRPALEVLEGRRLLADIRYIGGMGSNWSTDAN